MCAASTSSTPKILAQLMLVVHTSMNSTTNTISYLLQLRLALAIPLVNQYCAMMEKLLQNCG